MQCDLILVTSIQEHDNKEVNRTISPAKLQPAKRDQALMGRSNRFGFRQNTVRPTSSIQPRISEYADNVNNNCVPRSKSAVKRTNVILVDKIDEEMSTAVPQNAQNEMNANTM